MQGGIATTRLASQDEALILQIEHIETYAGAVLVAARNNPRGVPALPESTLISQDMEFPGIATSGRLPRMQERIVLECLVQLFVEHGICIAHAGLLVFPSLFRPTETDITEKFSSPISLYYDFFGAVDNIYSSLVSAVTLSGEFGSVRLWENRAEFSIPNRGVFGLRKIERQRGFAHLDVYFSEETPINLHQLFISVVEEHVRDHGVDIIEHVEVTCNCEFVFDEETVRGRILNGYSDVVCPRCETRVRISEGAKAARDRIPELRRRTWALRSQTKRRREEVVERTRRNLLRLEDSDRLALGPIRILHLSDLHISARTEVKSILRPLVADLMDPRSGIGVVSLSS